MHKKPKMLKHLRLCFKSMLMVLTRKSLKTLTKSIIHPLNKIKSSLPTEPKINQTLKKSKAKTKLLSPLRWKLNKNRRKRMKLPPPPKLLKRRKKMTPKCKKQMSNKKKMLKLHRKKTILMLQRRLLSKREKMPLRIQINWLLI